MDGVSFTQTCIRSNDRKVCAADAQHSPAYQSAQQGDFCKKGKLALKGFAAHSIEGAPQLTAHVHVHLHVGDGVCPRPFKKDELEKHSKEAEAEAKGCSSIACWTRTGLGTLPARNWHLPSVLGVWVERHDKG